MAWPIPSGDSISQTWTRGEWALLHTAGKTSMHGPRLATLGRPADLSLADTTQASTFFFYAHIPVSNPQPSDS